MSIKQSSKILRYIDINNIRYQLKEIVRKTISGYIERQFIDKLCYESNDGDCLIIKLIKD